MENKYGLQLRVPPSQKKKQTLRSPLPKPAGFADDVEEEISRQASKNMSLRDIEQQYKKLWKRTQAVRTRAQDGVYDAMKDQAVRTRAQDRPKYIQPRMDKAKQRERDQEIVYERKLAKERTKDDHLFADKDKFITSAYRRKLFEQDIWLEEERLLELREEKDDVTKKSDIMDFYFSLAKNVAYGARNAAKKEAELPRQEKEQPSFADRSEAGYSPAKAAAAASPSRVDEKHSSEASARLPPKTQDPIPSQTDEQPGPEQPKTDHHKRTEDALAAAKERFMTRKMAKVQ